MSERELWPLLHPYRKTRRLLEVALERGFIKQYRTSRCLGLGIHASAFLDTFAATEQSSSVHRGSLSQFFQLITRLNLAPVNCIFVFDGKTCIKSQNGDHIEEPEYSRRCLIYNEARSFVAPAGFHCHTAPGDASAELVEMNKRGVIDMIMTPTDSNINLLVMGPLCVVQISLNESDRLNELVLDIYDISSISHMLQPLGSHCKQSSKLSALAGNNRSDGRDSVSQAAPGQPITSWTTSPLGPSATASHWVPLIQDIKALTKCCRSSLKWTHDEILKYFEQKVYPGAVIQIICSENVYYDYRDGSLLAARLTQRIANQTKLLNPKPLLPVRVLNPQNIDPQDTVPATFSTRYFVQDVLLALERPSSDVVHSGSLTIELHIPVVLLLAATNPSRYGRLIDQPSPPISRKFYLVEGAPSTINCNNNDDE